MVFRVQSKTFALTYSCPTDKIVNPLTKEVLGYQLFQRFDVDELVVAQETHENGSFHYHAWLKTDERLRSRDVTLFDVEGVHPNIAKRKDSKGRYAKPDWLRYITKEDELPYEVGIDVKTYLEQQEKKKATKLSVVARDIYSNGLDVRKYASSNEHAAILMMHQDKLENFDSLCKQLKFEHLVLKELDVTALKYDASKRIARWWNYRMVQERFNKKVAGLHIWGEQKSKQKSAVLQVMAWLANQVNEHWSFTDKGWQEYYQSRFRLLTIDALSGPYVSFAMLENLGSGLQVKIKKRNDKKAFYQGPFAITANKPLTELYPLKDPEVLAVRVLSVYVEHPLIELVNLLITTHGLEKRQFYKPEPMEDWMTDFAAPPAKRQRVGEPDFVYPMFRK